MSKAEYVDDLIVQRAVERTLMNLIQSCIDLAQHIRASEGLSPSGTAKKRDCVAWECGHTLTRRPRTDGRSSRVPECSRPWVR
ncbi:HepT-like ribonuclease domain-containing protein [Haloferax sp. ATB1]|uniref:HepT-like ribonuclease domain-containing protein n=1 Tax=Haloferax sp. ATB1 TaxID=1508454 RepID=UPI00240F4BB9|nr:HepT-like ribonuclease domain-containing protein [Haloferax sp. ATB1]